MDFLLDVTRLIQRRDAPAPTGIDRVCLSYALFLAGKSGRSTHFVYQAGGQLHALERDLALPFFLGLDAQWQSGAPAPREAAHCKREIVARFNAAWGFVVNWRLKPDPPTLSGSVKRAFEETGANYAECLRIDFQRDFGGRFAWTERRLNGWSAWFARRTIGSVNAPLLATGRLFARLRRRRNPEAPAAVDERNESLQGRCLSNSATALLDRLRAAERPSVYLNVSHAGIEIPDVFEAVRTYGYRTEIVFYVHDLIPITHPEYVPEGDMARHESRMTTVATLSRRALVNSLDTARALAAFAQAKGLPSPEPIVLHIGVEPFGASEFRRLGRDERPAHQTVSARTADAPNGEIRASVNGEASRELASVEVADPPPPRSSVIVPFRSDAYDSGMTRNGARFAVDARGAATVSLSSLAFQQAAAGSAGAGALRRVTWFTSSRGAAIPAESRNVNGVHANGAHANGNADGAASSVVSLPPGFRRLKDVPLRGGEVFRLADPCFVVIGTIEPRKNHLLLLNLWRDFLAEFGVERTPHLYLIGKRGWENENVVDMLERSPNLSLVVSEMKGVTDVKMNAILRGCRALLFPTFTEGWGMPLAEALAAGVPAICSDIDVLHEAGQGIPDYVHPLDAMRWRSLILEYAGEDSERRRRQIELLRSYRPPSWRDHFDKLSEVFDVR